MSGEKNKLKTLAEIVAELRMGDDGGKPAYRIGRPDRVEISMPSREKIRSRVVEEVHISELADWIEAAAKREKAQHGNAAALREALANIRKFVGAWQESGLIEKSMAECIFANCARALSAPPRNCDVGSPKVQGIRCLATFRHWRKAYQGDMLITAIMKWAQMPYAEEEGAGK